MLMMIYPQTLPNVHVVFREEVQPQALEYFLYLVILHTFIKRKVSGIYPSPVTSDVDGPRYSQSPVVLYSYLGV